MISLSWKLGPAVLCCILLLPSYGVGQQEIEYNRDIRPILAEKCFACHGPDGAAREADLRLDEREGAIEYGAIVPNRPERSELIDRVFSDDPDEIMPPPEHKKTLSDEEKELLKNWIRDGAEYQRHWAFILPKQKPRPTVSRPDWSVNPIDDFILAKLDANQLTPAPEQEPGALFRRLHLDITGLPPSPKQINQFKADYSVDPDTAMSKWIDLLMESESWGEHRARYWLDAARYGDTHGLHFDNYREMWPYRDWVIRSFNSNQPYDQFTIEQLAGDLLDEPTDDQLIATGFQRCNITTNEGGTIKEENLALYAADRVQTFGWVYLGLTTNCCQCHDHKFDPISAKDYYSLAAYFRNTTQPALDGNVKDGRGPVLRVPSEADAKRLETLPAEIATAKGKVQARRENAQGVFETWLKNLGKSAEEETATVDKMLLFLPLNEGTGDVVSSAGETPLEFKSDSPLRWNNKGRYGSGPVFTNKTTLELGDIGDFELNESFSYGAWVKVAQKSSAAILARMDVPRGFRGWDLWVNGNSFSVHIIDSWPGNSMKVSTPANTVKPGEWQHVFATYDGSGTPAGIKIYVDGSLQELKVDNNSIKKDASIRTKTPTRIGQRSNTAVLNNGSVQDVRIYQKELTAKEVSVIANTGPVQNWLEAAESDRTDEQKQTLYNHFLATADSEFIEHSELLSKLEAEESAIQNRSPITHIQKEREDMNPMAHVLMRGEYDKKGEQVGAAPPAALHEMDESFPKNRLGLARWVVAPTNPLTARVTVNRFWQEVFGQGIVTTPEDFGVMGALPSHPDLLNWLAVEFQETGWDVKQLFKLMLMSRTYRQAPITTPEKLEMDRDNMLLSRGPRFRMDAEMVRDYALSVSGLLASKMYGPSVKPYQPGGLWDIVGLPGGDTRKFVQSKGDDLYRRSVYTFRKRMSPPPNLEAFNSPSREVCVVRRERTNTPLQALVTLNDPQFVEAARHVAQNALIAHGNDPEKVLAFISMHALGRTFNEMESEILVSEMKGFAAYYGSNPEDAKKLISVGESEANDSLDAVELATWTMVCNQVLNLDEVLNK